VPGWVYTVPAAAEAKLPALPVRCPQCSADSRRRGNFPSPLRNHITGFQKACQVLGGAQVREMPRGGRKEEERGRDSLRDPQRAKQSRPVFRSLDSAGATW
jgi:hypothetical protein